MCGQARKDKILNDCRKYWFDSYRGKHDRKLIKVCGLVIEMLLEALVRRVDDIVLSPVKRGRGRPIKTLEEIIKRDFMLNIILEIRLLIIAL